MRSLLALWILLFVGVAPIDADECGDVSGDGAVSMADAVLITRSLLVPPTATLARPDLCDVNDDGNCSQADATIVTRALLVPPTATINPGCLTPPVDRFVYIQPGSWCPDANGDLLEYPVLYAFNTGARLGAVAPASCAYVNGYTARTALHLRCERSGLWSPPVVAADAAFAALVTPHCASGTAQDFR